MAERRVLSRKSRSNANRLRRNRHAGSAIADGWDAFAERVEQGLDRRKRDPKRAPYDHPSSFLKREVYGYVYNHFKNHTQNRLHAWLDSGLEDPDRPLIVTKSTPAFKENPFHWVLLGLKYMEHTDIPKQTMSKMARHLVYARRHRVPVYFLIGFLLQCGSADEVYRKSKTGAREEWLPEWEPMWDAIIDAEE